MEGTHGYAYRAETAVLHALSPHCGELQTACLLGNEGRILSPSDAKHYFCFFLEPGSVTFKRLVAELQKPIDKGKYKHEDRDPVTGQRSYCGVPIPADAPPRPNEQAVWCDGKWVY